MESGFSETGLYIEQKDASVRSHYTLIRCSEEEEARLQRDRVLVRFVRFLHHSVNSQQGCRVCAEVGVVDLTSLFRTRSQLTFL